MITFKICNWINSKKLVFNWWCIFSHRRQRWWWGCAQLRIRCGTQKHSTANGLTQFHGLAGWLVGWPLLDPWNTIGDLLLSLFSPPRRKINQQVVCGGHIFKQDPSTGRLQCCPCAGRSVTVEIPLKKVWQKKMGLLCFPLTYRIVPASTHFHSFQENL